MPFKCVVPGCRSNYHHAKGTPSIPMMRFPTDPEMVAAWVKAIHRPDFTPTVHSHVCIKHFKVDQQIWREYHRQPDGSYRNVTRRYAKLRPGAIPTLFDVDPSQWKMRSRKKCQRKTPPKLDMSHCEIITGYKVQFKPEMWEDEPEEREEVPLAEESPPVKRRRGRPRKYPLAEPKTDNTSTDKIDYVSCCALACTNTSELHVMSCLPKDSILRQCWIEKLDRLYWTPDEDSALCEIHFEPEMWINDGEQKILKEDAIPSLFLHAEAIKSWVTLDNSSSELVENQDSNEVIEVSQSESEEEDPDIYVKREILEPQIDMVEGVEDVLSHNPNSAGEQFETIYCDTTFQGDEGLLEEPHTLDIKEEIDRDGSIIEGGNPLEPDCFVQYSMKDSDTSLIQDDRVTMSETKGKVKRFVKPGKEPQESKYFVISDSNRPPTKVIRRRKSSQLTNEFQCPVCLKKLSRQKNLYIHIEKLHKNGELSEGQKMRKNGASDLVEDNSTILRKRLQFKKSPPPLKPIGTNSVLPSPPPVESSNLPLPPLNPIYPLNGIFPPSSEIPKIPSSLLPTSNMTTNVNVTSSSTSTLLVTSTSTPVIATSSSMPNLFATSSSMPTLLASTSSTPTLLATTSSMPSLIPTSSSACNLHSNTQTLLATSAVVAAPCHNDPSPSGGRIQNQFLLLLPKHPNSSSMPFDQAMLMKPPNDSNYSIDLSQVPGKEREKLKEKIKEMINAVLLKKLDPGKIIIAYDRT